VWSFVIVLFWFVVWIDWHNNAADVRCYSSIYRLYKFGTGCVVKTDNALEPCARRLLQVSHLHIIGEHDPLIMIYVLTAWRLANVVN
jgi:hypothetical protein